MVLKELLSSAKRARKNVRVLSKVWVLWRKIGTLINVPPNRWLLRLFGPLKFFGFWQFFNRLATTITTTITSINPIKLNHNLRRASWWVYQWAHSKHQGEWRSNLGSELFPVGINTLTRRVDLNPRQWISVFHSQPQTHNQRLPSVRMNNIRSASGWLERSRQNHHCNHPHHQLYHTQPQSGSG